MSGTQATEVITDTGGRQIEVRRLNRRDAMSYMRRWGTACNIETWLGNAMLAAMVRGIDGVPIPSPYTPDQVEILVERLDTAGLDAVGAWLMEKTAERDMTAEREAAKN